MTRCVDQSATRRPEGYATDGGATGGAVRPWLANLGGLLAAWLVICCGCAPTARATPTSKAAPAAGPASSSGGGASQVRVDGRGLLLGEAWRSGTTLQQLLGSVRDLLAAGRRTSAGWLVASHPDVALEALRSADNSQAGSTALQFVAAAYDGVTGPPADGAGWSALWHDRLARPAAYRPWDEARAAMLNHMQNGQFKAAAAVKVGTPAPHALLAVEAGRLRGVVLLLDDQPGPAARELAAAAELAQAGYPYLAAQLWLLHVEAGRRSAQPAAALDSWRRAVELAAPMLSREQFADPSFWNAALSLRPGEASWPASLGSAVQASGVKASAGAGALVSAVVIENGLWERIGDWHMARGEPRMAVVAYARAQGDGVQQPGLRLKQAGAMLQLEQTGAAMGMLTSLAESSEPLIARAARARIGVVETRRGRLPAAIESLRAAVGDGANWPGLASAQADLGLALLLAGQEQEGLAMLHAAQERFVAAGPEMALMQSLQNEEVFLRRRGRPREAVAVAARLRNLEAAAHFSPPGQ